MSVVRELVSTLAKMFIADLWLTAAAVGAVALAGAALRARLVDPGALPFLLAGAIALSLALGVARGARPKA
jgi:hypothetical protein